MAGDDDMRLVPQSVITDAWVALVPALNHPLGQCWGTVHADGTKTYEKADPPCFTCAAVNALAPFHHGEEGRIERARRVREYDDEERIIVGRSTYWKAAI